MGRAPPFKTHASRRLKGMLCVFVLSLADSSRALAPSQFALASSPTHPAALGSSTSVGYRQAQRFFQLGRLEERRYLSVLVSFLVDPAADGDAAARPPTATVDRSKAKDVTWQDALSNLRSMKNLERDEVVRVLDPNTVKLERGGLVSFAAVQTPSGYGRGESFPDCSTFSPSKKVRQLLPRGTKVRVWYDASASSSKRPRPALILKDDGTFVNGELVRSGFAKPAVRGRESFERLLPGLGEGLASLQREAQSKGVGLYQMCDEKDEAAENQFEPLDFTLQTNWGADGGQPFVRSKDKVKSQPPNPGDTKGCSDFDTYEDALKWYEAYFPWYGDVAKLDRDRDGVPCPGLPHTKSQEKYRMKIPQRPD